MRSGSADAKEKAAGALFSLAFDNDANATAIAAAGGIAPLVRLLCRGSAAAQEAAVGVVSILTFNDANDAAIVEAGGIPPLIELLRRGSVDAK